MLLRYRTIHCNTVRYMHRYVPCADGRPPAGPGQRGIRGWLSQAPAQGPASACKGHRGPSVRAAPPPCRVLALLRHTPTVPWQAAGLARERAPAAGLAERGCQEPHFWRRWHRSGSPPGEIAERGRSETDGQSAIQYFCTIQVRYIVSIHILHARPHYPVHRSVTL